LDQAWLTIKASIHTHLQQLLLTLKIRHITPPTLADFLPPITDFSSIDYLPPIKCLAVGIFPTYILSDFHSMGIRQNFKKLGVSMLKHAMDAF